MKIKRALEEVAAEAQKDGYGFEYMRNIRDGSLEMRIFKGRFGERVTLPVREIDFQGFNLDDTIKDEVEVKKLGIGIYCSGEILIPLVTEDRHMVGIICQSHLAPLEDEIKNNGFIRYYQRKQTDGTVYYVVKNGMRVRAAVMAYTVPDYAEAKLQELVAMLAETHIGEQEEPEQTFDDLNAEKDSEQQE